MNTADVCTKSLPGDRIRDLCRIARVYVLRRRDHGWMSRADVTNSHRASTLSLKERVDFTCLICCNQAHFAFPVGHEFVNPSFELVLWKLECFRHALVVSVCDVCLLPELKQRAPTVRFHQLPVQKSLLAEFYPHRFSRFFPLFIPASSSFSQASNYFNLPLEPIEWRSVHVGVNCEHMQALAANIFQRHPKWQ